MVYHCDTHSITVWDSWQIFQAKWKRYLNTAEKKLRSWIEVLPLLGAVICINNGGKIRLWPIVIFNTMIHPPTVWCLFRSWCVGHVILVDSFWFECKRVDSNILVLVVGRNHPFINWMFDQHIVLQCGVPSYVCWFISPETIVLWCTISQCEIGFMRPQV